MICITYALYIWHEQNRYKKEADENGKYFSTNPSEMKQVLLHAYTHKHREPFVMTLCKYLSMSFRGTDNYIEGTHPTGWQASKCVRASHASASVCVYGCVHYCAGIWYKKVYPCVWTGGYRHRLENVFLCLLMTHLLTAVSYKEFLMRSTNPDY